MSKSWCRCAALCGAFSLFAHTAHAQVLIARVTQVPVSRQMSQSQPSVAKPITTAAEAIAAQSGGQEAAEQIASLADESWMNGWMLAGIGAMAAGAYMVYEADAKLQELNYDDETGTYEDLMMWGGVTMLAGGALAGIGFFLNKSNVWVKKTPGGFAAGKTFTLGKKSAPAKHRERK